MNVIELDDGTLLLTIEVSEEDLDTLIDRLSPIIVTPDDTDVINEMDIEVIDSWWEAEDGEKHHIVDRPDEATLVHSVDIEL